MLTRNITGCRPLLFLLFVWFGGWIYFTQLKDLFNWAIRFANFAWVEEGLKLAEVGYENFHEICLPILFMELYFFVCVFFLRSVLSYRNFFQCDELILCYLNYSGSVKGPQEELELCRWVNWRLRASLMNFFKIKKKIS